MGRIHTDKDIRFTIDNIIKHDFNSFNIDLMYGLPNQNIHDAVHDLQEALSFNPPHISWYQLTIEPNTNFYNSTPKLPNDKTIYNIMQTGTALLKKNNYVNYEISAFAKPNYYCKHNLNYWQYGDYLGLGPGAHSKITTIINNNFNIIRLVKPKSPKNYFYNTTYEQRILTQQEIIFEFMLNNLRLKDGFFKKDFIHRTSFGLDCINNILDIAVNKKLLNITTNKIKPTALGRRFLNNLQELFV